jgi:hypothetical protein
MRLADRYSASPKGLTFPWKADSERGGPRACPGPGLPGASGPCPSRRVTGSRQPAGECGRRRLRRCRWPRPGGQRGLRVGRLVNLRVACSGPRPWCWRWRALPPAASGDAAAAARMSAVASPLTRLSALPRLLALSGDFKRLGSESAWTRPGQARPGLQQAKKQGRESRVTQMTPSE